MKSAEEHLAAAEKYADLAQRYWTRAESQPRAQVLATLAVAYAKIADVIVLSGMGEWPDDPALSHGKEQAASGEQSCYFVTDDERLWWKGPGDTEPVFLASRLGVGNAVFDAAVLLLTEPDDALRDAYVADVRRVLAALREEAGR